MKDRADKELGLNVDKIMLGRPAVVFSLVESEHQLAIDRLEKAALMAGFKDVNFALNLLQQRINSKKNWTQ